MRATEEADIEKLAMEQPAQPEMVDLENAKTRRDSDASKGASQPGGVAEHVHGIPIIYGRPPVPGIISAEVEQTGVGQKVLVLGCGPDGLMAEVRGVTARCITGRGPAVDLHCEKFGL
ncbi:hypothetical protein IMZ48_19310 [Candidatus Bathyarchaeota archaeon]|nr:hypothetical protein [Candidatus Bathyarchaeota archaeon]